jgi:hypothetical protein
MVRVVEVRMWEIRGCCVRIPGLRKVTIFDASRLTVCSSRTDYPVEPLTLGIKPLKKPVDKDGSTIQADGSDGDEFDPTFGVTDINFPFQGMTEATFDQTEQWFDIISCPQFNPFPASSSTVKRRWSA